MANPATIYCRELGYQYERVDTDEGQYGVCVFPDGSRCDEWRFLEGKCGQSYSYCARQGYGLITKTDGRDPLSREYGVCVRGQEEIGSINELMGLSELAGRGAFRGEQAASPPKEEPSVATLPSFFDWRSYNGQDWMTSVKNQGICGSCWAFSAVGAVEGAYNVGLGDPSLDLDLSEEYLVSDCHTYGGYENCCGGWNNEALYFIRDTGIPDEACLPYVDGSWLDGCSCSSTCASNCTYRTDTDCSDRTCSDRCSDWSSRMRKIAATGLVSSQSQIKQAIIDKGPVSVCLNFDGDFDGQNVYRCDDDYNTNHCVVVLGYNDTGGYWIAKNSWGTSFGDNGYFNVGYGECAIENYVYYADPPVCDPVIPGTYAGSVTIDGAPASDGTIVTASIGGLQWEIAATSGGNYAINIPPFLPDELPCFEGGQIVFQANGGTCTPSPDWALGLHSDVNLVCTAPACIVYTSSDVPKPIPDVTTIVSTVNVGGAFALTDATVRLSIDHTWDADLDVFLISSHGTRVELFTDVGGSGDHFTNTFLDDECIRSIGSGAAPFTGCYRPEGALSAVDGQNASGVWTLEVTDDEAIVAGTLQSWSLELCGASLDSDGDGWSDGDEGYIGTDSLDACPDVVGSPGLCPGPSCNGDDAWPPDINVDTWANILDVLLYKPIMITSVPPSPARFDLNADGDINILDVLLYKPIIMTQCANP
jgi:C1A family cysteine protease/subtilisin-like proprotein convertase family protein